MITILACYERISLYHTMLPFFAKNRELKKKSGKNIFRLTQSAEYCLKNDTNSVLFMERCFQHREPRETNEAELALLRKLRDKYRTIVFFCGQPEAGNNRLDILPYVDRLFYKSIFADSRNYLKKLYGKNLFADYYHRVFGITDNPVYICDDEIPGEAARRPELSWNIGMGTYPRWHWPQRAGTILARTGMPGLGRLIGGKSAGRLESSGFISAEAPKDFSGGKRSIAVHARIDPVTCPSIAHQRILFRNIIASLPSPKKELFTTGMVPQRRYYPELMDSKIVLSPFGWGEVCFRDFEAILAGALLFKPDMSHLKTWPDVYIPCETYVPLKWDGSDLAAQTERYLNNETERRRIAANAYDQYRKELSGLSQRIDSLIGEYY